MLQQKQQNIVQRLVSFSVLFFFFFLSLIVIFFLKTILIVGVGQILVGVGQILVGVGFSRCRPVEKTLVDRLTAP